MESKKELLEKKIEIFKKMLENKDKLVETLVQEQAKHKDILNPNFVHKNTDEETSKAKE